MRVEPDGRAWVDYDELVDQLAAGGPWSGGEGRVLTLIAALGADDGMLSETLPGLDRGNVALVLAAVSHAAGSHEHPPAPIIWGTDDKGEPRPYRNPDKSRPGPLYPWPATESEGTP